MRGQPFTAFIHPKNSFTGLRCAFEEMTAIYGVQHATED